MTTGEYPVDALDLGPLLPDGADCDPFNSGQLLRIAPETPEGWTIYSVGLDGKDNHANGYDPVRGTGGGDDVTLAMPREPVYPFPRPGEMPNNRNAILALFKKGLPSDPFCGFGDSTYAVSDTVPPVIWSVGPDRDESAWRMPPPGGTATSPCPTGRSLRRGSDGCYEVLQNMPAQAAYDPTNGIRSAGNLYMLVGSQPIAGAVP